MADSDWLVDAMAAGFTRQQAEFLETQTVSHDELEDALSEEGDEDEVEEEVEP